jgi:hypothetical protein
MNDNQAVELLRAIRAHAGLELASIRDAGTYGADGGFGGFIYYGDTSEFYEANEPLLWAVLMEDAADFGFNNVPAFVGSFNRAEMAEDETGFQCLVSWYALERVGHWLNDRREARLGSWT